MTKRMHAGSDLEKAGIKVLRFENSLIELRPEKAIQQIEEFLRIKKNESK